MGKQGAFTLIQLYLTMIDKLLADTLPCYLQGFYLTRNILNHILRDGICWQIWQIIFHRSIFYCKPEGLTASCLAFLGHIRSIKGSRHPSLGALICAICLNGNSGIRGHIYIAINILQHNRLIVITAAENGILNVYLGGKLAAAFLFGQQILIVPTAILPLENAYICFINIYFTNALSKGFVQHSPGTKPDNCFIHMGQLFRFFIIYIQALNLQLPPGHNLYPAQIHLGCQKLCSHSACLAGSRFHKALRGYICI